MHKLTVDAVLFDMDGTLIDSTPGVLKAWDAFGERYGFDAAAAAHASHGRRLHDTLKDYCKIDDEGLLAEEVRRFEDEVILGGPVALPGAVSLIEQIRKKSGEEALDWTIVTSATSIYAKAALVQCNIPLPAAGLVASDDVSKGKPFPDPYLAGAKKCGIDPSKCLVVEDAPSGIRSGHAAGSKTLAVCTSHTIEQIIASGSNPDYIVEDLTRVSVTWVDGKLEFTIDDSLNKLSN